MITKSSLEKSSSLKGIFLLAVSGGADSVAMLHLLFNAVHRDRLYVMYIEHGIRGEESVEDGDFVRSLCESVNLPFFEEKIAVPSNMRQGESLEEAARRLRYDALVKKAAGLAEERGECCYITTAHHLDDQAETVLFRMIRGTGPGGLRGIELLRATSEEMVFLYRPLLDYSRAEIQEYLHSIGQPYRTDATNLKSDYDRNKIRLGVMPGLKEINPKAAAHMGQLAAQMSELYGFVDASAKAVLKEGVSPAGELCSSAIDGQHPALAKEVIRLYVAQRTRGQKDITAEHYDGILGLFEKRTGQSLSLPGGYTAVRTYDGIDIRAEKPQATLIDSAVEGLFFQGPPIEIKIPGGGLSFEISQRADIPYEEPVIYTKYLDYDKITEDIRVRSRREGDYLTIDDGGHRKSLKAFFVNQKIPAEKRDKIPLVCCGSHVLWVVGHRLSAEAKISAKTKKVLKISFIREGDYEA